VGEAARECRAPLATEGTATEIRGRRVRLRASPMTAPSRPLEAREPSRDLVPDQINRHDLHHLMVSGQGAVLVEALGAGYYADAHLPGAVNIPPGHVDRLAPALLPAGRRRSSCTAPAPVPAVTRSPRASNSSATRPSPCTAAARRSGLNTASRWNGSTPTANDARCFVRAAQGPSEPHARRAALSTPDDVIDPAGGTHESNRQRADRHRPVPSPPTEAGASTLSGPTRSRLTAKTDHRSLDGASLAQLRTW
jgi:hypothetical protein